MACVSPTPSIHSVRRVFPSTAGSTPSRGNLPLGFPQAFDPALAAHSVSGLTYPVLWSSGVPTGPWLSTVYHVRTCKRYYDLIRRSLELRTA